MGHRRRIRSDARARDDRGRDRLQGRDRIRGGDRIQGRDRGQVALEYIGFIPVLLFVALCGIQLGWVGYVHQQAETAARTAARVEARNPGSGAAAGTAAVSSGLDPSVKISKGPDAVTARVSIPIKSIVPGLSIDPATATAVMPDDDPSGARP
ncbi:TadE/TadG family type IV pilus assembly protein [Streptomyces sp. NPDC059456]|uniref:TadE/TadG family type IV pilus assembly protein n=1 Tax=Streptomyces sp. NPDC059456 TaxID=3346838 RepID=UPI0036A6B329